jgi:endonuclease YncB( thermonuclease family)
MPLTCWVRAVDPGQRRTARVWRPDQGDVNVT